MLIATSQITKNNASVGKVLLAILTLDVDYNQFRLVCLTLVVLVHSVLFPQKAIHYASVQKDMEVIQQDLEVVMVTNVLLMIIVPITKLVSVTDVEIHVQDHAELMLIVELKDIIQYVLVNTA